MVPPMALYQFGDLTSTAGAAGQGELGVSPAGTPSEKVFGSHYIVKLTNAALAPQGQPGPYGRWYAGPADLETKAIQGYA